MALRYNIKDAFEETWRTLANAKAAKTQRISETHKHGDTELFCPLSLRVSMFNV